MKKSTQPQIKYILRDQVTMGLFSGEVRFRGNTVVEDDVAQGAAYKDLWGNFVRDITSGDDATSAAQAAKDIMAMMHGKPKALMDNISHYSLLRQEHAAKAASR